MSTATKTCIDCPNEVDEEALKLNPAGLWCAPCERARRKRLSASFAEINASFEGPSDEH